MYIYMYMCIYIYIYIHMFIHRLLVPLAALAAPGGSGRLGPTQRDKVILAL